MESKKKDTAPKMSEAAKAARARYLREWRQKNKAKQVEYKVRYWERKVAVEAGQE